MKHILCTVLTFATAIAAFAADAPDNNNALQGTWSPIEAELGGQAMPAAVLKSISLKLENGKYEVAIAGSMDRGTYTVDSAAEPKGMTITGTEGPNNGKTFPAIFEIKGDTLRICYDLSGMKRPTEFKSVPGTRLYLVTYSRSKQ